MHYYLSMLLRSLVIVFLLIGAAGCGVVHTLVQPPPNGCEFVEVPWRGGRVRVCVRASLGGRQGAVVVGLHGNPGDSAFDFEQPLGSRLRAAGASYVFLDRPGHGFSAAIHHGTPRDQAAVVRAAVDAVAERRPRIIVAYSWSAALAVEWVAAGDEWVKGVVLISPVSLHDRNSIETPWTNAVYRVPLGGDFLVMELAATPIGAQVARSRLACALSPDPVEIVPADCRVDFLSRVRTPAHVDASVHDDVTLLDWLDQRDQATRATAALKSLPCTVLVGTRDGVCAPESSGLRLRAHARVITLDGRGHALMWSAPDAVMGAINDLLSANS